MQHHPSDYRMMAAMCEEIANGMLLDADRLRLKDRVQEWLELAQQTEAEQLPQIADCPRGESSQSVESQTHTDAIDPGKTNEAEQLPGLAQACLESRTQADVIELVQTTKTEQLPEITYGGGAESVQSLELESRADAKSRAQTDFMAENREIADDTRVGIGITNRTPASQFDQSTSSAERGGHRFAASRSVGVGRRWWMLSNVLLLAVLALVLTAALAWGP
jgi:hypothetical protein